MKKVLLALVLAAMVMVAGMVPAMAEEAAPSALEELMQRATGAVENLGKVTGKIEVQGNATIAVTPDIVYITAGVTVEGKPVSEGQEIVNKAMADMIKALTELGIPPEMMGTSNYSIYPTYDYSNGKNEIIGYTVSNQLNITVKDFSKINQVIDAAINNGANQIYNLTFGCSTQDEAYGRALSLAIQNAQQKAKDMAQAAGKELGAMVQLTEVPQYNYAQPMLAGRVAMDNASGAQIMAGQSEIVAQVTMVFEAK